MKGKLIQLLLSLLFWLSLLFLSGDLKKIMEKLKRSQPEQTGEIQITDVRVDDDGTRQMISFSVRNETPDEICFDRNYELYFMDSENPVRVTEKNDVVPEGSDYIIAGESKQMSFCLTDRYERLNVGSYRLSKSFGVKTKDVPFEIVG